MVNAADKNSGKIFRSGGSEYMEHRKQQLRESPKYQALIEKRKAKLKSRLKSGN